MINPSDADASQAPLWEKADEAAGRNDYAGVLFVLKSLAEKGVWQAYARIGELYEAGGGGVEKNLDAALSWYRRGVYEGDDPVAHIGMGRAYFNGTGVERDASKALAHFQKADSANMPEASLYLGIIHYSEVGVDRDHQKARKYFEAAATAGYFLAYGYLARIAFGKWNLWKGIKYLVTGWLLMARISRMNPKDPRLLGIETDKQ